MYYICICLSDDVEFAQVCMLSCRRTQIFSVCVMCVAYRPVGTINRSHSTPCKKAEFEHLLFFHDIAWTFFLPVSGKVCHSPFKQKKNQPTLMISLSQHPPFFEGQ